MNEYISKIKKCIDALAAIYFVWFGLGVEYNTMASAITTKIGSQSVQDVMASSYPIP